MSGKIMGAVWDLDLPHSQQLVLLAMADHADHLGNNVYPSTGLVAWKTGYSDRQVQRIIQSLVVDKLLIVVKQNKHAPNVYRIDVSAGKQKLPYQPPKRGDILTPQENDNSSIEENSRGDILALRGDIAVSGLGVTSDVTLTVIEPKNHLSNPPKSGGSTDADPFGSNIDVIPKKQAEQIAIVKADLAAEKLSIPETPKGEITPSENALEKTPSKVALKVSPQEGDQSTVTGEEFIQTLERAAGKTIAVALPTTTKPAKVVDLTKGSNDALFDWVARHIVGLDPLKAYHDKDINRHIWSLVAKLVNAEKDLLKAITLDKARREHLAGELPRFLKFYDVVCPGCDRPQDHAKFARYIMQWYAAPNGRTQRTVASAPKADPDCLLCKGLGVIVTTGPDGDYSEPCTCKKASAS